MNFKNKKNMKVKKRIMEEKEVYIGYGGNMLSLYLLSHAKQHFLLGYHCDMMRSN